MSRILFVPFVELGHIQSVIGLMQALERDGHEIICYGAAQESTVKQLAAANIHCQWQRGPLDERFPPPSSRKTALLRDPRRLAHFLALSVAQSLQAERIQLLRDAIRRAAPDVVCCDAIKVHGGVAAELEGVPWAAYSVLMQGAADPSWRCPIVSASEALHDSTLDQMRAAGASAPREHIGETISPFLNIMFVSEAFVPRSLSGNDYAWYVGPSRPLGARGDEAEFPWSQLRSDVPIVYMSGGGGHSVSYEPEHFLSVARSLTADEAQFVFAVHDRVDDAFVRELPAHCLAVRYAPQVALLQSRVAVMVTHGGINTVNECLTAGRPMLVAPIAHEQFIQAYAVERIGGGLSMDLDELTPERCRAALLRLLDPREGFVAALEPVRRAYQHNGALRAAELIAELARTRAPMMPL